jgi:hypothetical protein
MPSDTTVGPASDADPAGLDPEPLPADGDVTATPESGGG